MKGEGRVYQRGGTWWADYSVHGVRYRVSTEKDNEKEATSWLRQRMAEVAAGVASPDADKAALASLVECYLDDTADNSNNKRVRAKWEKHMKGWFGNVKAGKVTTDLIRAYIKKRKSQEPCPENSTINRELAILSAALNLAKKEGKVRVVPYIPRLKEDNVRKGFLRDEQYDVLARETAKWGLWMRAIFETGFTFGWREQEVLGLNTDRVNLKEKTIRLETGETKNAEGREVEMTSTLFALISACCEGKKLGDPVFTHGDGKRVKTIQYAWEKCTGAAGVPDLRFHDLRRTAVRNMVRAGVAEKVAMEISGHKTRSIFDRYHIVSGSDLREAARKIEKAQKAFGTNAAQIPSEDAPERTQKPQIN